MSHVNTPVAQRRSILDFCLAPLQVRLGAESAGDVPARLQIGGHVLDLNEWEQGALSDSMGSTPAKPWASLVAEGVAFRLGCKLQVAEFLKKSSTQSLVTFVAAGLALSAEIQQMIDLLIVAGDVGSAKQLTQFRHKIIQDVTSMRRLLAYGEYGRAEQESAQMIGPPRSDMPVSSSTGRIPKGAGEYKPRKKEPIDPFFAIPAEALPEEALEEFPEADPSADGRRIRRMSMLLFASSLVWMIFFMPRLFEPRAQVLEKLQFEHLPAVSTITARPPSLFVEVQPEAWDALDPGGRRELLEEIGRIAVSANYNGAQVKKDKGGEVVGRWLREQGARLVSGS